MGLVISRCENQPFWVGDNWFQVIKIDAAGGCQIVDRKGAQFAVSFDGPTDVGSNVSVKQGFRRSPEVARLVFAGPKEIPIWRDELRSPESLVPASQSEVAMLAPVPYEHLVAGLDNVNEFGKVAFGSRSFEVFRTLEHELAGLECPVLIYASDDAAPFPVTATWVARFVRSVESNSGRHPDGMKFRPKSTEQYSSDNIGHWAVFWEVTDLKQVGAKSGWPVRLLRSFRTGKPFKQNYRPEGPTLIENPLGD